MHEALVIEREPDTNDLSLSSNNNSSKLHNEIMNSVKTKIQIKILLRDKKQKLLKKPYIKEEIIVKKISNKNTYYNELK